MNVVVCMLAGAAYRVIGNFIDSRYDT